MSDNQQPDQPPGPSRGPDAGGSYASAPQPDPGPPAQPTYGQQPYPGPQAPYPGSQGSYPGAPAAGGPPPYPGQPPYGGQQAYPGQQPYGSPQPYPGQPPYPGQQPPALQQYPQPYGGYPGQPPYGTPPRQQKSRVPLFIGLGAGVLVLILIAAFALTQSTVSGTVPTGTATTGTNPTGAAPPQSADAATAVTGYLEAVAGGDALTALSYAASPPEDAALLSNEMLAAARAAAPITGIVVTAGSGADHQNVQANYLIGDSPASTTFGVTNVGGTWMLDSVAFELPLDLSATDGLDLTINGLPLQSDAAVVFPGQYTVKTASGWYKVSGGTVLVDGNASLSPSDVGLKLSSSGVSAVRKAAQAKLNSCLKKKSLSPSGCGFGVYLPGNNKVRTSTIRWQVISGANAMKTLKPTLYSGNTATAKVSVKTRNDCSSTNGTRWRGYSTIHSVYATLGNGKVSVTLGG